MLNAWFRNKPHQCTINVQGCETQCCILQPNAVLINLSDEKQTSHESCWTQTHCGTHTNFALFLHKLCVKQMQPVSYLDVRNASLAFKWQDVPFNHYLLQHYLICSTNKNIQNLCCHNTKFEFSHTKIMFSHTNFSRFSRRPCNKSMVLCVMRS